MGERKRARILVVDDEPEIVKAIRTNLEMEGYEVLEAYNGPDALRIAREERPDLMVLDVLMPEMDGWEVLEKMRADPEFRDTPVIMLTALAQAHDIARSWEVGADSHLVKPFDPLELITLVKRLLRSKQGEGGE